MPYIQTRTNCGIDKEKEIRIKERLGEAIRILGKSEDWLMVEFVPNCNLFFADEYPNTCKSVFIIQNSTPVSPDFIILSTALPPPPPTPPIMILAIFPV